MAELDIQLRLVHRRLCGRQRSLRRRLLLHALVITLHRARAAGLQHIQTMRLLGGKGELRLRREHRSLRLRQLDLIRPRVDDEQQIALMHDLPVGKIDLGKVTAHLGENLNIVHWGELAGEIGPVGGAGGQSCAHGYRRRAGAAGLSRRPRS